MLPPTIDEDIPSTITLLASRWPPCAVRLVVTPGARLMISFGRALRPAFGRFCRSVSSSLVVEAAVFTSTTGVSPLTVTVSVTAPTCMTRSTVTVVPNCTCRPVRCTVWKPCSVASTS